MIRAVMGIMAALMATCASGQDTNRGELVSETVGLMPKVQATCPVMEGKPVNERLFVDYQGFRIFVCCGTCVKAVRKDPGKYLKRLQDQGIALRKT